MQGNMNIAKYRENFFVITGGPGSGKSTLIDSLEQRGYARTVEAGRAIIQDQIAIAGRALPWDDRVLFSELMLSWETRSYRMAENAAGPVFFDRGVTDVLGYLKLIGEPVPEHLQNAARNFRYNRNVFIAPPWKEIFHEDVERKQSFDEAVRTYEALVAAYSDGDYDLIELPRVSVDERARFVLDLVRKTIHPTGSSK
jgi:predicted ATPase